MNKHLFHSFYLWISYCHIRWNVAFLSLSNSISSKYKRGNTATLSCFKKYFKSNFISAGAFFGFHILIALNTVLFARIFGIPTLISMLSKSFWLIKNSSSSFFIYFDQIISKWNKQDSFWHNTLPKSVDVLVIRKCFLILTLKINLTKERYFTFKKSDSYQDNHIKYFMYYKKKYKYRTFSKENIFRLIFISNTLFLSIKWDIFIKKLFDLTRMSIPNLFRTGVGQGHE